MSDFTYGAVTGTTTDNYTAVDLPADLSGFLNKTFIVENTDGANAIKWRLVVSNDGTNFAVEKSEATLNSGDNAVYALNNYYSHVKLELAANAAGSQATFRIQYAAYGNE